MDDCSSRRCAAGGCRRYPLCRDLVLDVTPSRRLQAARYTDTGSTKLFTDLYDVLSEPLGQSQCREPDDEDDNPSTRVTLSVETIDEGRSAILLGILAI